MHAVPNIEFTEGDKFDPEDPQPGIYLGVHEETYHSCQAAVSKHMLDGVELPERLRWELDHKENKKSDALIEGSLLDCLVFEPHEFPARFWVIPENLNTRTNDGKARIAEVAATGKQPIKPAQKKAAEIQRDGIRRLSYADMLLSTGYAQVVLVWEDPATGLMCKSRLDWWNNVLNDCVDLKTVREASMHIFGRQVAEYRYHVQAGFYNAGWKALTGEPFTNFQFLLVEKRPPYCAAVRHLDIPAIARGNYLWRRDLLRYAVCYTDGRWPGYADDSVAQGIPSWAFYD